MDFIVQKDYLIWDDFVLELLRSDEYWKWRNPKDPLVNIYYEKDLDNFKDKFLCPVGRVEFVINWIKSNYPDKIIKPINIPKEFFNSNYIGRKVINTSLKNEVYKFYNNEKIFIKSMEEIKSPLNGIYKLEEINNLFDKNPNTLFQISEYVPNIVSEWRVFIYNEEILDIRCYLGDPFVIPKRKDIEQIISIIKNPPISYTLDVMVTSDNSVNILEMHDFFSCGLYGFSDYTKYPYMLYRWFYNFIKK